MLRASALLIACAVVACAQNPAPACNTATIPVCGAGGPSGEVQVKPQAVPTSSTVVAPSDAYIESVTVANTTAGAIPFTLADQQASPVAMLSALPVPAHTILVIVFSVPYWAPGGFTLVASSTGLNFWAKWKQ